MKKIASMILFLFLFVAPSAFAKDYQLKVEQIHCEKCVQKIHDYFIKNLGDRIQNLKIDAATKMITFESISVDVTERENIQKGLEMMGFKKTEWLKGI